MNLPWVHQMGEVLPWRRTSLFCGLTARNTGWMCCSHCHGSVGSFAGIHAAPDPSMLLRRFHGTKKRGKLHLSVGSVRDPWGRHQPVTVHFSQVFFASSKACLMGLLRLPIAVAVHGQF